MFKLIVTLCFLLISIVEARIFMIDDEKKLLMMIKFLPTLEDKEHMLILKPIELSDPIVLPQSMYKTYKINLVDNNGKILKTSFIEEIINEINKISFEKMEKELAMEKKELEIAVSLNTSKTTPLKEDKDGDELMIKERKTMVDENDFSSLKNLIKEEKNDDNSLSIGKQSNTQPQSQIKKEKITVPKEEYVHLDTNNETSNEIKNSLPKNEVETKIKALDNTNEKDISSLIQSVIEKNKDVVKKNVEEPNFIEKQVETIKKEKVSSVSNPFRPSNIDFFEVAGKKYTKSDLIKQMKVEKNENELKEMFVVLRAIEDEKLFDDLQLIFNSLESKVGVNTQVYMLNTLIMFKRTIENEKKLGKILLRNQSIVDEKELRVSYKLLGLY